MERRKFGQTDMNVSVLGFGGAEIGFRGVATETVTRILGAALEAGINVIDTAECYGESEELIGRTVSHRRKDFYLFTKAGHVDTYYTEDWSQKGVTERLDRSLKRLRTDYVDLLQLHSCDQSVLRKGEVIEALQKARAAGKTRYIGYSGDGADALYAIGTGVFDSLQTSVSVADQEAIDLTLPPAREKGLGIIAKRPLANVAWKDKSRPWDEYAEVYWQRLRKLNYDFLEADLSAAVAIALRFTLSVPGVCTAIVGTTSPERLRDNTEIPDLGPLPAADFEAIRRQWQAAADRSWVGQV